MTEPNLIPPEHGDNVSPPPGDDRPVPVCPICHALMRRQLTLTGDHTLACDLHGVRTPIWETEET